MEYDVTIGSKGAGPCRDCGEHSVGRWPGLRCHPCWARFVEERANRVEAGPTALYRLYDAGGHLLYIGITIDIKRRFKERGSTMPWWPEVARRDIVWLDYGGRRAAWAEIDAIRAELPWYNKSAFDDGENGDVLWPNLPPGCPPQPWQLEFESKAEYQVSWRRWRAVLRECLLNPEEQAARDAVA